MSRVKILCTAMSTLAIYGSTNTAFAQENNNEFSAIIACKNIVASTERLACYDLAAGRLDTAQQNGEIVAISKKEIETVERDAFGFNIPSLPNLFGLGNSSKSASVDKKAEKSLESPLTAPVEPPKTEESQKQIIEKSAEIEDKKIKPTKRQSIKEAIESNQIKEVTFDIAKTTEFGRGKKRFFLANGQVWEQADKGSIRIPKARGGNVNHVKITKAAFGTYNLRVNGKGRAYKVKRVR